MNVGQQKYVVSYTLKGKEKQPDILNAQKSATEINDTIFKMKTPALIRPDDLFNTASSSSTRSLSNLISQNPHNLQKLIDLNSQSYISNNQSMTTHYSIHPPPYSRDFEASLNFPVTYEFGSGITTSQTATCEGNNLNNLFNCSEGNSNSKNYFQNNMTENTTDNSSELGSSAVDNSNSNSDNNRDIEAYDFLSYKANNINNDEDFFTSPEFVNNSVDYKNLANQIANTISNINSTLNRSRNRNHILTENLPGPESCV